MNNDVKIKLDWENKEKNLLYFDENRVPIWGELESISDRKIIEKYQYQHNKTSGKSNNILVKGDNLVSLLNLRKDFRNKIKCIYIDPPFNTGKTFNHYSDGLERPLWLSMMKVRLELLRDLLSEDGSIFVHIDDDEMPYLKVLMDEIFNHDDDIVTGNASGNHVATIVWQKKSSPQNDAKFFSDTHDYILVYAKNKKNLRLNGISRTNKQDDRYTNRDNDDRGVWTSSDLTVKTPNPKYLYEIKLPSGRIVRPSASRSWGISEETFKKLVKDNRIWFGESGNSMPRRKRFLSEVKQEVTPKTIWLRDEVGDNSEGKKEVKRFSEIADDVFTTPKPERLLKRILEIATNEGDWVLDAFLGSGTTCATAHKMNRQWIGLENGEQIDTICVPRIKAIIDGKDNGGITKSVSWENGGGFRYCELSD
ncbi:site-specific DNA-methyltransferase [Lactococcus lactis]|uniref:site-specific DNA-methyltransferase n=1 Tax=Lactococcus lactis TaxID=1358 RepID=UPI00071E3057|nr:site-specific DNA-methyltransferase [Lactococcus lactis]KSU21912.1 Type III restriction-modification system methylation subunit [Lactococcus lactis subsp. lactis]TRW75138.1 site-specific DNA-methyltransferase [Lactococcus lactis]